ncbi:hypothetical protein [Streptomyces laculatispora]|uniref:hypothetical protein n=1 Tax=Streptomyces laculatispora TaxID=887464 RepID=UPI001F5E38F8|nr:hypothetical protein [Streptomyces laculatispora]
MVRPSEPFHSTTPAMAAEMFGGCRRRARNAWTTSGPWVQRRVRITAEQFIGLGPILAGVVRAAGGSLAAVFVMLGTLAVVGAAVAGTLAGETADRPLGEIAP